MNKIGIYKIISPSNKIYIGQAIDINKRWQQYYKLDKSCVGPKILNSLKKYGIENHKFEIIEECPIEYLNELEIWWKMFYGPLCVENGLNCEYFDTGGGLKSEETKNKMSNTHQIYLTKPEILAKRLINCKKSSTKESNKKKVQNINWEERNKNLRKPRKLYKRIEKYDLNNNLLKEYFNISEILEEFNNPKPQNLYTCLKGTYKTWMGYKWRGYH